MKKILIFLVSLVISISFFFGVSAECKYSDSSDITAMVEGCIKDTTVVAVEGNGTIEDGFKKKIQNWTNNIALFLGLLSIGAIIYGGLMMTLSTGEDEKIKKAKDIVKWALLGLLGVILATTIVTLVINVMYGLPVASTVSK